MGERYIRVWAPDNGHVLFLSIVTIWDGGTLWAINGGGERHSLASNYTLTTTLQQCCVLITLDRKVRESPGVWSSCDNCEHLCAVGRESCAVLILLVTYFPVIGWNSSASVKIVSDCSLFNIQLSCAWRFWCLFIVCSALLRRSILYQVIYFLACFTGTGNSRSCCLHWNSLSYCLELTTISPVSSLCENTRCLKTKCAAFIFLWLGNYVDTVLEFLE